MPQKNEDDQHDRDDDVDDRGLRRANGVVDQLGTVVNGNNLHPYGKSGLYLFDFGFYTVDDVEGVLAVAHNDNAADHFARAIEIHKPAPQIGPHHHLADVSNADLRACLADVQRDVFKVFERARVTAAADHVFRAPKFNQPAARFIVAAANRFEHTAYRDSIGPQTVGVEVYLVLPGIAANGRNLGYARHRLQVIAQIPILIRAQISEAVLARGVHQSVLDYPSEGCCVRAKFGLDPIRQAGKHARQILHNSGTRPVQIRAILKDDVHVGVAEIGEP